MALLAKLIFSNTKGCKLFSKLELLRSLKGLSLKDILLLIISSVDFIPTCTISLNIFSGKVPLETPINSVGFLTN